MQGSGPLEALGMKNGNRSRPFAQEEMQRDKPREQGTCEHRSGVYMRVNGYLRAASNAAIEAFARCPQFTVNAYEK